MDIIAGLMKSHGNRAKVLHVIASLPLPIPTHLARPALIGTSYRSTVLIGEAQASNPPPGTFRPVLSHQGEAPRLPGAGQVLRAPSRPRLHPDGQPACSW